MTLSRIWLGRLIAATAIVAAIAIGAYTLDRLARQPRTHDAFLFADRAGLAPEVSGRIVSLNVRDNQCVSKGDTLAGLFNAKHSDIVSKVIQI